MSTYSNVYSIPLRYMWILFGVIYFFPGFWKIWGCGFDWIFSDNFMHILREKWFEDPSYQAIFRLDTFPLLYKSGAFFAVAFELSFIFLIFVPLWRFLAIFSAYAFHKSTIYFINISFSNLTHCYVVFFDWQRIFDTLRGKISIEASTQKIRQRELRPSVLLHIFSITLISGNIFCGFRGGYSNGWPYFTNYPSFAYFQDSSVELSQITFLDAKNKKIKVVSFRDLNFIPTHRRSSVNHTFMTKEMKSQKEMLQRLLRAWSEKEPSIKDTLSKTHSLKVTIARVSLHPDSSGTVLSQRDLFKLRLGQPPAVTSPNSEVSKPPN